MHGFMILLTFVIEREVISFQIGSRDFTKVTKLERCQYQMQKLLHTYKVLAKYITCKSTPNYHLVESRLYATIKGRC
ncbi:hypothetical protein V6Z11_A01G212700 [Gossypium hirsutum]